MSITLSVAQVTLFDSQVKHAYQGVGELRSTVRFRQNKGIRTWQVPKMGKGVAKRRTRQAFRNLMNVAHTKAQIIPSDWEAAEVTDIFDQFETNVDERKELAKVIAGAISRREDQLIIDEWEGATLSKSVATSIGGANTGLNTTKCRRMKALLDINDVPKSDRHFIGHSNSAEALLGETDATSSDFNTVRALVQGEINTWLGFEFHWIGDRDEGGLNLAGGDVRNNFAFHGGPGGSTALGVILNGPVKTTYENLLGGWLSAQDYDAGAKVIDEIGVVEVLTDET